jgi:hypothetical protein
MSKCSCCGLLCVNSLPKVPRHQFCLLVIGGNSLKKWLQEG